MEKRTLILLSAPRCGSTAIHQMFQRHPDVGICCVDQSVKNVEPHFWNLAVKAIDGNPEPLISKLSITLPSIALPGKYTEETVFQLWDTIVEKQGPIVFEKSPYYLGNRGAMQLLYRYVKRGNDVRIFGLIRDPRDAITSQYELWTGHLKLSSPETRAKIWLNQYRHLEEMQKNFGYIPVFRYEDFSAAPSCYAPMIFNFCGLRNIPYAYDHIKPTNIGRKSATLNRDIRKWVMSNEFNNHLKKFGYLRAQESTIKQLLMFFTMLPGNIHRVILSIVKTYNIRYFKKQW